jgi:hypothetical protein
MGGAEPQAGSQDTRIVADEPQSIGLELDAWRLGSGILLVEGSQPLSNSCLSLGDLVEGAPDNVTELVNAKAVTLEIRHSGDEMCAMAITDAPFRLEMRDLPDRPYVVLYRKWVGYPSSIREVEDTVNGLIAVKRIPD